MSRKRRAGAQRKRRSDRGTWKKSGRDQDGMLFVAQQKFVRLDTLAEFFAPGYERAVDPPKHQQHDQAQSAEDTEGGEPQSAVKKQRGGRRTGLPWPKDTRHRMMAVQRIVLHWADPMGLAETWQPWASQPPWVRIIQPGLVELHLDVDAEGEPYWTEIPWPDDERLRDDGREFLSHTHRINMVRMALARGDVPDIPKKHIWHSEREIEATLPKKVRGVRLPHKTDGYVELEQNWTWQFERKNGDIDIIQLPRGSRIAIEVELSRKRFAAYERFILPDLLKFYDFALYFATKDAYQAVVDARRNSLPTDDLRRRIRILRLE